MQYYTVKQLSKKDKRKEVKKMDVDQFSEKIVNQLNFVIEEVLDELRLRCATYNDLTKELKKVQRKFRWKGNTNGIRIIDIMLESVEKEKGNLKISSHP